MANTVEIISCAEHEGSNALVVTSGNPSGTLTFMVCRTPSGTKIDTPSVSTGSNNWIVAIPSTGLWYVWTKDNNGTSAECKAVWKTYGDHFPLMDISIAIADRLKLNREGINAALRTVEPNSEIKHIVAGNGSIISEYPAILIAPASRSNQFEFAPHTFIVNFGVKIYLYMFKEDSDPREDIVSQAAEAVQYILNQKEYLSMSAGGLCLSQCYVSDISLEENAGNDGRLQHSAVLSWTAMAYDNIGG